MTERILQHLKMEQSAPTLVYLQELIAAYCRTVPWESVSRIVKKKSHQKPENCLRLEEEFWTSALENGTGGTCYESNWAFFWLLQSLGYQGYLTINNVIDKSSCHAAIIVIIERCKYIADVGYPMYGPVSIHEGETTLTETPLITYRSTAITKDEYGIENVPHPKLYLFHLKDIPVSAAAYLKMAAADYGEKGLFLDRIVIRKVIDGVPTRFDSADLPYNIHLLQQGAKHKNHIASQDVITALHSHFGIDKELLQKAFAALT